MTALVISELTTAEVAGTGVFDVLMRSAKSHLDQQFKDGRIKGPEYATVYLGSLELAMQTGLAFVLQQRKNDLEAQLLDKQLLLADKELVKADAAIAQLTAQTALVTQQTANAVIEGEVLTAQKCKLQAEFDFTQAQTLKSAQELALLTQKTATERAQITALGVDADSVVGRQKDLYMAQTSGFARDAEQKAAKLMVDTWSVRRTTDEATLATDITTTKDGVTYPPNYLGDATIGRAVTKLLTGVGA